MIKEGSWWLKSEQDPRWNYNGRGYVGMFISYEQLPEAKAVYQAKEAELGPAPDDLEFGYMKD